MEALKQDFALIDVDEFQRLMGAHGFELLEQKRRSVSAGKALWLGMFARN